MIASPKWPRIRLVPAIAALLLSTHFALVGAVSWVEGAVGVEAYLPYLAGGIGYWVSIPIPLTAVVNAPDPRGRWLRFLAINATGFTLFAALATGVQLELWRAFSVWFGCEPPSRGLGRELLAALPQSSTSYVTIVLSFSAIQAWRAHREARRRAAALESQVARAQYEALASRLDPTFLFESLARVREALALDVTLAERLLQSLSDRLREMLDTPPDTSASPVRPSVSAALGKLPASDGGVGVHRHWSWPPLRRTWNAKTLLLCLTATALQGTAMAVPAGQVSTTLYANHLVYGLGLWTALPIAQTFVLNAPPFHRWLLYLTLLQPSAALFGLAHLGATYLFGCVVLGQLGLPLPEMGIVSWFLRSLPTSATFFAGLVALLTAFESWDAHQRAHLRVVELQSSLSKSRLAVLSARLEPHFLYNALNTLSALVHEDVALTRRLLSSFEILLHNVLANACATWSLAEEQVYTAHFVDFVRARFDDRVRVDWRLGGLPDAALVPRFALQGLVENAVKHNQDRRAPLVIRLEGRHVNERLTLSVSDDGRGLRGPLERTGGLQRLREILGLLYGSTARLSHAEPTHGGCRFELDFPLRYDGAGE